MYTTGNAIKRFIKQFPRNFFACLMLWKWATIEHAGDGGVHISVDSGIQLSGDVEMLIKQQQIEKQETLRLLTQRYNWLG